MAKEYTLLKMVIFTKVIGKMINWMARENLFGKMVTSILANGVMMSKKVMEKRNTLLVIHTKVITQMTEDTVKEHSDGQTARQKKENILMEKK